MKTLSRYLLLFFLVPATLLFSIYISSPQYQTTEHPVSLLSWLFLSLAYVLGKPGLVAQAERTGLPATGNSIASMLVLALWFALTLEPPK